MNHRHNIPGILLLVLFATTITFAQPKGEDIVIGQSFSLKSEVLNEDRPYQIYLPMDYSEDGNPISVMYLLDGDGHFHHTSGVVSFLRNNGRIPNLMIVAIPNTGERTRDLTPAVEIDTNALKQMPNAGGADNMLSFIKNELIPHIDESYNTSPYKILTGHSFGGLFAVHSLLSEPELFDAYISISPSMWWDDQNLVAKAEAFFEEKPELACYFYMTMGNEDGTMLGGAMKLAALFEENKSNDFRWDFNVMDDETHGSIPHRSTYYGLEAIFKDWYVIDFQKLYAESGFEGVKAHYSMVSKKLGFEMNPPEVEMNNLGYAFLGNDKIDEALEVFLTNIKINPKSFNAYDSAGEAYMAKKDNDLAIEYYKKSLQLNPGNTNGIEMLAKLGVKINPEDLEVKLSKEEQKKYLGEYDIDLGGVLTVQIEDGKLKASHPAIPTQTMLYYSNNIFMLLPENVPMTYTLDEDGKPSGFEVRLGVGRTATGTKKE
jgi:predicted alpha/beta superfamily hydrolase